MFKRGWLYLIAGLVITVVLVIATTVAGTAERAGATTTTVTVFADEPGFTDTGVMLAEGESFNVSASWDGPVYLHKPERGTERLPFSQSQMRI